MKNPKKSLIISLIAFAVLLGIVALAVTITAVHATDYINKSMSNSDAPAIVPVDKMVDTPVFDGGGASGDVQSAPVESQPAPTTTNPTETATVPQAQQGGHIPFTNEPVVSGKPETYINTVGQCPFYEIAGEKGCIPPVDIECNSDWTICKYLGQ